jgi:nucleoside-diphosphate-sugar epimerase
MKNTQNELHVIFGTGPVGITLAEQLSLAGKRVRLVNRSGKGQAPVGVELVAGDALQSDVVRNLCQGAATVYHCANVSYEQQVAVIPRLQESIVEGVAPTGAKLIVTDTLYMYGQTHGQVMKENSPNAATTRKGQMRARVAEAYLTAHHEGKVRIALGRAADFFGPRILNSALGDRVFPAALAGKSIQVFGNIDLPHCYSYIGDVARGLALLGERDEALQQCSERWSQKSYDRMRVCEHTLKIYGNGFCMQSIKGSHGQRLSRCLTSHALRLSAI